MKTRASVTITTLSNDDIGLPTHMAKWASLPRDCVLSTEVCKALQAAP